MSASASYSSSEQETTNTDKRLTTSAGDIFAIQDSELNSGGGAISISAGGREVAEAALATVGDLARTVTQGSNEIAAQVAASQEQFVSAASGQKTLVYALAAGAAVLILPKLFGKGAA